MKYLNIYGATVQPTLNKIASACHDDLTLVQYSSVSQGSSCMRMNCEGAAPCSVEPHLCFVPRSTALLAAWWLTAILLPAQDPLHRRYEVKDGLPSNTVYAALQDREGYMWFATDAGVARFDGHTFRTFSVEDGLTDNQAIGLAEDSRGRIWVLTLNGRLCYIHQGLVHGPAQVPELDRYRASAGWQSFAEDGQGHLWFGGVRDECLRLDLAGPEDSLFRFAGTKVSVVRDARGEVAVINGGSVLQQSAPGRFHQAPWTNDLFYRPVHRQALDGSGTVLSVGPRGLCTLRDGQWALTHPMELRSLVHTLAWVDGVGDVWIRRSDGGVEHLEQGLPATRRRLFPEQLVNDVLVDDRGGRWTCTSGRGVLYSQAGQFRAAVHKVTTGRQDDPLLSLLVMGPDSILVGTTYGQVLRFNGRAMRPLPFADPGRVLRLVRDQQGGVWLASDRSLGHWTGDGVRVQDVGGRLSEVDPGTYHPRGIAKCVAIAPLGRTWCGSFGLQEVVHTPDGLERRPRWDLPVRERVVAMHAPSNDSLWFATDDALQLLRGDQVARVPLPTGAAGHRITDLAGAPGGHLFVATAGSGLLQLDPAQRMVAQLTTAHGLPSDQIARIRVQHDTLLVVTDRGLVLVPLPLPPMGQRPRLTFRSDLLGLQVSDAAFAGQALVAATDQGLCVLPRRLSSAAAPAPRLVLNGLWVQGLPHPLRDTLHLKEGHTQLRVAFRAIEFAESERVQYAYALDPAGPWTPAPTAAIDLTTLSPGEHRLAFKARVGDGPWCAPRLLAVTVAPHWWNSAEARLLMAGALLGALLLATILLVRRRYRAELALLRQREAVNEERRRIAADVHDDLGADLSSLLLHARQAERRPEPEVLHRVTDGIGRAVSKIDEIIWSLDPRRDTLQTTLAFVEQQLAELFTLHSIRFRSACDLPVAPVALTAELRREVLMVLREAARNVVKHAGASEVWLRCALHGAEVCVVLEDNGRGLPATATTGRNGLANMYTRAARIGGTLRMGPIMPSGTRVELCFTATGIIRSDDARMGRQQHIAP